MQEKKNENMMKMNESKNGKVKIKHKLFYWFHFCKRTVWGIQLNYRYSECFMGLQPDVKLHPFC